MTKIKPIILSAFLRRTLQAYALKMYIRSTGSVLTRIGRSRNWNLIADPQQLCQIINFIESSAQPSWLWLARQLKQHREHITHEELLAIAKRQPQITVNQLMALTDCTIAQARKIIDELEWVDE